MKCVAIDFETANSKRSSVCALGLAIIEGQTLVKRTSWLIRPPELHFDPFNTYIHGISVKDVEDKPEFYQLWDEIFPFLQGGCLIAHNASFDMSVLCSILDVYKIPHPPLNYFCTLAIAKRVWPGLLGYALNKISRHLEIEFKHHNAEEDAVACAKILLHAYNETGVNNLEELAKKIKLTERFLLRNNCESQPNSPSCISAVKKE
ncbi:MAG: 3'-5' exonuclease [Candidatus Kuenenia sp.]|nr:3'-5' exonuclease [Candidatus Kuenenia hertensis]